MPARSTKIIPGRNCLSVEWHCYQVVSGGKFPSQSPFFSRLTGRFALLASALEKVKLEGEAPAELSISANSCTMLNLMPFDLGSISLFTTKTPASIMETEIKDVLTRLMESIKLSDKEGIVHGMGEMEGILNQSRAQLHPQLAHFLERRSYAKALDFLGGASDIPRGSCGPR